MSYVDFILSSRANRPFAKRAPGRIRRSERKARIAAKSFILSAI